MTPRKQQSPREKLRRWIKGLSLVAMMMALYVLIDFSFNQVTDLPTYRFEISALPINTPRLLTDDKVMILIARYDTKTLDQLQSKGRVSRISESFRQSQPRVDEQGYFVAMAYGTDRGCPLKMMPEGFMETCSDARYDLLGRSMNPQAYADLDIPQYTVSQNHSILTVN